MYKSITLCYFGECQQQLNFKSLIKKLFATDSRTFYHFYSVVVVGWLVLLLSLLCVCIRRVAPRSTQSEIWIPYISIYMRYMVVRCAKCTERKKHIFSLYPLDAFSFFAYQWYQLTIYHFKFIMVIKGKETIYCSILEPYIFDKHSIFSSIFPFFF